MTVTDENRYDREKKWQSYLWKSMIERRNELPMKMYDREKKWERY